MPAGKLYYVFKSKGTSKNKRICKELKDIHRLYLIYRGDEKDDPLRIDAPAKVVDSACYDSSNLKIKNKKQMMPLAKKGDFMMVYSTSEDTLSRRYSNAGSPLIQCFSKTIIELFEGGKLQETDFLHVVDITQKKVCREFPGMQPVFENSLSKDFFLPIKGSLGFYYAC